MTIHGTNDTVAAAIHRDFGMAYRALYIPWNRVRRAAFGCFMFRSMP